MKQIELTKDDKNNIKTYLSSITARKCPLMYLGIARAKNEYILSNLDPSKMVLFCDGTLGFHFLKVKNPAINRSIKKIIKWLQLDESTAQVVHINNVITCFNKHSWSLEKIEIETDQYGIKTYSLADKNGKVTKTPVAYPNRVYQSYLYIDKVYTEHVKTEETSPMWVIDNRLYIFGGLESNSSSDDVWKYDLDHDTWEQVQEYSDKLKVYSYGINAEMLKKNNLISKRIEVSKMSPDSQIKDFQFMLIDGVEAVSCKSFVSKLKKDVEPFYRILCWIKDYCIEYHTFYDDKNIQVTSTRPNMRIYLKPTNKRKKRK